MMYISTNCCGQNWDTREGFPPSILVHSTCYDLFLTLFPELKGVKEKLRRKLLLIFILLKRNLWDPLYWMIDPNDGSLIAKKKTNKKTKCKNLLILFS